ncbi:MAG: hypothetical protein AAB221_15145 [Bacteroidota bacterium]
MEKKIDKMKGTMGDQNNRGKLYVASLNKELIAAYLTYDALSEVYEESRAGYKASVIVETGSTSGDNWMPAILTPEEEKMLYNEYY